MAPTLPLWCCAGWPFGPSGGHGLDTLVVGAGVSGCALAERLAAQKGQRVRVVDKRSPIGGNASDRHDDAGVLVHPNGPRNFLTDSAEMVATCRSSVPGDPASTGCWPVSTASCCRSRSTWTR